ncbi:MAG: hypothetical protein RJR37_09565 [Peptococcaceae bacterium MAG4]|nr:hypothetical protein [Peptococcaceae bacterium MAG4]
MAPMNGRGFEFLEGFEKRMQIVAAVDSIVNRGNRRMDIERLFEPGQLDNIIFSVLVFIMERTLAEDEECTMDSIAAFVAGILPDYGLDFPAQAVRTLTEYIIKDILQNGGEARYYPVMRYGQGLAPVRIRLIDDKLKEGERGYVTTYQLTDQGYDLLFRTKEVEQEISFTIEELKLRELIRRKNYKKAIGQSANLVQMIRQKKNDIRQFIQKIRENIYDVDIQEFERLVSSTYNLLEEEYGIMKEIRDMIVLSESRLKEEEASRGYLDEEMRRARSEIAVIRRNINTTIDEQQELILERHSLARIYKETIADSFSLSLARNYDFEREILIPLERCRESVVPSLWKLLNPLFRPNPDRKLNLLSLFERQSRLRQEEDSVEGVAIEELGEDTEWSKIKRMNEANTEFIRSILEFAAGKGAAYRFGELFEYLKEREDIIELLTADDLIFKSMLKLYDLNVIDIKAWKEQHDEVVANATGELDVGFCLYCIEDKHPDLYGVEKIEITKPDERVFEEEISSRRGDVMFSRRVAISDFVFEVSFA